MASNAVAIPIAVAVGVVVAVLALLPGLRERRDLRAGRQNESPAPIVTNGQKMWLGALIVAGLLALTLGGVALFDRPNGQSPPLWDQVAILILFCGLVLATVVRAVRRRIRRGDSAEEPVARNRP